MIEFIKNWRMSRIEGIRMADIKHIKELIEEIDLCKELLGGITDYKGGTIRKDSGKEQTISSKDLDKLLENTPRPLDTVEVECTERFKEYMEKKYGKLNKR